MKRFIHLLFLWQFCFITSSVAQQNTMYIVIVNKSNPVVSLSSKEIADLFLKRTKKWDNGQKVLPIDVTESHSVRHNFSKEILQKKITAVKAFWQKQIFTGRDVPPPEKASEIEVLEYVQNNEGAIGYVAKSAIIEKFNNVKVIAISDFNRSHKK